MPEWKPHALHAIWFVNGQPQVRPEDLYHTAIGAPPLGSQMGQAAPPSTGAVWNITGNDGTYAYQLQVQLGRVDISLSPYVAAGPPPDGAPLMASLEGGARRMLEVAERVAHKLDGAMRVAAVADLQHPERSLADANATLGSVLGSNFIYPDATDVVFQMNKRKAFGSVADLEMNRVLNWSVATIQTIMFAVPQAVGSLLPGLGGPMSTQGAQIKESFAANLRVDINTFSRQPRAYSSGEQLAIFRDMTDEMIRLAKESSPGALA